MADFWTWLNTPPTVEQVLDPFAVVYLLVFGVGFVASAYLNGPHAAPLAGNAIQREGIVHWSFVGLWIFGPGLFFFGVRALQINPLSMGEPIWLVASVIAAAIAGIRCVQWWRTTYPALIAVGVKDLEIDRSLAQLGTAELATNQPWRVGSPSDFRLPSSDS
jgi:hypothetical protein